MGVSVVYHTEGMELNHVSSCLPIYLAQLHPTIDVTFTKQPKTKAEGWTQTFHNLTSDHLFYSPVAN